MNRLAELEASMRVLSLQNESCTIADSNELLLLSKFMEYKDSHPKTTQREICRSLNIPENRLLVAKKKYGLTKTRKRKPKKDKSDSISDSTKKEPSKKRLSRKIEAGTLPVVVETDETSSLAQDKVRSKSLA